MERQIQSRPARNHLDPLQVVAKNSTNLLQGSQQALSSDGLLAQSARVRRVSGRTGSFRWKRKRLSKNVRLAVGNGLVNYGHSSAATMSLLPIAGLDGVRNGHICRGRRFAIAEEIVTAGVQGACLCLCVKSAPLAAFPLPGRVIGSRLECACDSICFCRGSLSFLHGALRRGQCGTAGHWQSCAMITLACDGTPMQQTRAARSIFPHEPVPESLRIAMRGRQSLMSDEPQRPIASRCTICLFGQMSDVRCLEHRKQREVDSMPKRFGLRRDKHSAEFPPNILPLLQ